MEKEMQLSPLSLAYLGDAVIEIIIRKKLVSGSLTKPALLHKKAIQYVSATAQSTALDNILPILTEEELAFYKRGRNAKNTAPKSTDICHYKRATGFECLFGFLAIRDQTQRIEQLINLAYNF